MERLVQKIWYESKSWPLLLLPLEIIFTTVVGIRRSLYRRGILKSHKLPVPVIIVGNINVGGTGKTPLVIWLSQRLRREGWVPGILSRGYGGSSAGEPQAVTLGSDPTHVGDEPVVLARRSGCRVVAGQDRVAAAALLLKEGVNVVICDDGLQHLRLKRGFEILVADGERGFGNGHCLPAGPLREPRTRLKTVDLIVQNGGAKPVPAPEFVPLLRMTLRQLVAVPLTGGETRRLGEFKGQRVHALAGIGNPERFFRELENQGLEIIRHPFPDHAPLGMDDVLFMDNHPVLMTEKDAVKCADFADQRHYFVPVTAELKERDAQFLMDKLNAILGVKPGMTKPRSEVQA